MRSRLILLALLLAAPLMLAVTGLFIWSYQRERAAAEEQLRTTARAVALVVDGRLAQAESLVKALATSTNLTSNDLGAFDLQARDAARHVDGWIVLTAQSGQQLINTRLPPGATLPSSPGVKENWRELEAGRSIVTNLIARADDGERIFGVNVPVVRDGRTVFALAVGTRPSTLGRLLDEQALPDGWIGAILDRSWVIVARTPSPERYMGQPATASLRALLESGPSGTGLSTTYGGEEVATAWSRSPAYGWTFAIGVPSDQLAAVARRSAIITALLGLCALVAGAGLAARVARGITRPVEALATGAQALGRGLPVPDASTGLDAADDVVHAMQAAAVALREREARLRDSEELFRTMLETLPHIAIMLDPDGTAHYHNRRFIEYIGAATTSFESRISTIHPDDRARHLEARQRGRMTGTEYAFEARLKRHDGVYRWHTFQMRPLCRNGEIVSWLGTAVDIDDMRRLNETLEMRVEQRTRELETAYESLRQAQKLEAIGQLTGGVAHDFNNLLTAVIGNLELLRRRVAEPPARRLIDNAHRAAERGARLTESLLAFARRQSLRPEIANANRLIKEFAVLLRRAAGDSVEVQFVFSPVLDPCRFDSAQFQSAILNLVVNARDAMPPSGGRITIETANVEFAAHELASEPDTNPGSFVSIVVSDTGAGMPPEILARAFEPFFTTKEVGKGSGLGLSQVYGFAKQSGGFARIESEVGVGTKVQIYIPRSQDAAVGDPRKPASRGSRAGTGRGETILVVEDDPDVRNTAAEALRALGYEVRVAVNGTDALAQLHSDQTIDLLFSDLSMPSGLNGDELAHRAIALRPGLKVLLTSGYAAAAAGLSPADAFALLPKPYSHETLAHAIRAKLDGVADGTITDATR
ncbi:MAG: PAS domain S-box protein [Deltaproteobacteria bacterium]|nr:MAG: PAS domain S-box protein [Deltaproteobacteria bacterium]